MRLTPESFFKTQACSLVISKPSIYLFLLLSLIIVWTGAQVITVVDKTVVSTTNGPYQGEKRINYYAFEGIRYARPPLGELRFQPPRPYIDVHNETVDAMKPGTPCMQYFINGTIIGDEDCLFLNIYTPNPNASAMLPVVVHIHGGGFVVGQGDAYGPGHLMQRKLVLVNFNYRLGPLGFLSTETKEISGNMGLKDQVLALQYIKSNILQFGGDPDKITISGWSAGGASVQLHYLSYLSKGLFVSGISHSGSALNPWVMQSEPVVKFHKVCDLVGCAHDMLSERIKCLKLIPASKIVATVGQLQFFKGSPFNPFGVVVEPVGAAERFLIKHPLILLKEGKFQRLPWLISGVRDEGYYPAAEYLKLNSTAFDEINANFHTVMPQVLHFPYNFSLDRGAAISERIRRHYLGELPVSNQTFVAFVKIITDYLYLTGLQASVQLQSNLMPVYAYGFDYKTLRGFGEAWSELKQVPGIAHGEDITLIYETGLRENLPYTVDETMVMNRLLDMYETYVTWG